MSPTSSPCIVFLGPSLRVEDARALYAEAEYRPPVRRGDLDQLSPGTVVGIIDGVFDQELAVSPREVWNALLRGIHVIGSSSMGAMRAAEVRGVRGVGRVYEMFARGEIERDDEVALLFDPQTYRALSEPLVNVRYAVERLVDSGTLARDNGRRILAAARDLHYRDRDYRTILHNAGLAGAHDSTTLLELLRRHNIKREDAQLLLEELPAFREQTRNAPQRSDGAAPVYEIAEYRDHLSARTVQGQMPATSPVLIWEFGETLEFRELLHFLKLTGQLLPYARAAISRYLLQGNQLAAAVEHTAAPSSETSAAEDRRQMLVEVMAQWGWYTAEEARVTLIDLGLGLSTLFERLEEEAAARRAVLGLLQQEPPELLEALRCELVMNDIALKRCALRLGAFKYFAAKSCELGPLSQRDRESAQRALCRIHGELTWAATLDGLAQLGVQRDSVLAFVDELAHVRRAGLPWLEAMTGARASRAHTRPQRRRGSTANDPAHIQLRRSPKAQGSPRFCVPIRQGERLAEHVARTIGITRVALVGELDELSVQISQAYRPESPWSTTAGSGKSETRAGARIGGILEEAEKYAQERFARIDTIASYQQMLRKRAAVVDPRELDLPYDSRYRPDTKIGWTRCYDLIQDEPCYVPSALVICDRVKDDALYCARLGEKIFSSSGLASGFTLEEALTHALCEVIERHALRIAELHNSNPGTARPAQYSFVDLTTAPAAVRRLARKLTAPGHELRALDITADVKLACFEARLFSFDSLKPFSAVGTACHPNAEVALHMALLEAAQTKIGSVSGSREDLTLAARSLGRHERPRPFRNACESEWYGEDAPHKSFRQIESFVSRDARADVRHVLDRLRAVGVQRAIAVDYTLPELRPMRAVRVLLPGLESANQFYTGPRARALALADLLPRPPLGAQRNA